MGAGGTHRGTEDHFTMTSVPLGSVSVRPPGRRDSLFRSPSSGFNCSITVTVPFGIQYRSMECDCDRERNTHLEPGGPIEAVPGSLSSWFSLRPKVRLPANTEYEHRLSSLITAGPRLFHRYIPSRDSAGQLEWNAEPDPIIGRSPVTNFRVVSRAFCTGPPVPTKAGRRGEPLAWRGFPSRASPVRRSSLR